MAETGILDAIREWIGQGGIAAVAAALAGVAATVLARARKKKRERAAEADAAAEAAKLAAEAAAARLEAPAPVERRAPLAVPPEAAAAPVLEPELRVVGEPTAAPAPPPVAAPAPAASAPPVAAPAPRVSLRERLARTQAALVGRALQLVGGRTLDAELESELEALLFTADLGVKTAEDLLARVKRDAAGGSADRVRVALRGAIAEKLRRVEPSGEALATAAKPHVIVVLGVNGSGKTTTIGKLAARYRAAGKSVLLGAGDTFRAAAREQLQRWGERAGCEVIAGADGGDPAAVAFDTVKAAVARGVDVAIVDTAGRLQTKQPLMQELAKIVRIVGRECPGAPHETLLVLDANTGQNAISQAREFTQAAGVTGIVLTKLDGTAKGGVIVGLADEFGIPVKYVGVGEGVEDLRDFSADEFVAALFAD
jgi:fused signal recognition particle receptor